MPEPEGLSLQRRAPDLVISTVTRSNGDVFRAATLFVRLLELPDDAVLRVLTFVMAVTLSAGSALVEAVGFLVKPDVATWWAADDTFLELVRDRGAVHAMLGQVAGQATADVFRHAILTP